MFGEPKKPLEIDILLGKFAHIERKREVWVTMKGWAQGRLVQFMKVLSFSLNGLTSFIWGESPQSKWQLIFDHASWHDHN